MEYRTESRFREMAARARINAKKAERRGDTALAAEYRAAAIRADKLAKLAKLGAVAG